jgi:hypothetical protein
MIADELAKNSQAMLKLQMQTLEAVDEMSESIMSPRQITLHRDKSGRATGATSVATASETENEAE